MMDGWMDGWVGGQISMDEWVVGMHTWNECMAEYVKELIK